MQPKPQSHTNTALDTSADAPSLLDQLLADVQAAGRDTTALSREDRAAMLVELSRRLGLNPLSNAVMFLRTQGRETLYVTKQGTDQIAAREKLCRETIKGPEVQVIEGKKVVFCQVRATHPDGRSEVSTATLALADVVNDLMKCESKAKRRATLSMCGLGLLAEDEIETIPGAQRVIEPPSAVPPPEQETRPAEPPPSSEEGPAPGAAERDEQAAGILADYGDAVDAVELPGEATQVWLRYRAQLATLSAAEREAAWKALCKKTEEVGKMRNAKVWLKKSITEEDARRAGSDPGPLDDPPAGGGGAPSGASKSTTPATGASRRASGDGPQALLVAVPDWSRDPATMASHVAGYGLPLVVEAAVRKYRYTLGDTYLGLCALRLESVTQSDHLGSRLTAEGARALVRRWADEGPVRTQTGTQKRAGGRRG